MFSQPNSTLVSALWPDRGSRMLRLGAIVLLGTLLLTASAKIQVPFWPVPMTMQTFVVLFLGAALCLTAEAQPSEPFGAGGTGGGGSPAVGGAGGIGTELIGSLRILDYPQVLAILIAILGCVIVVDALGGMLRRRLS